MKTITLYQIHNHDSLCGGWEWSTTPNYGDLITCTPYEVELPDDFSLAETVSGEMMFFHDGEDMAYTLTIGRSAENGKPYLVGCRGEMIALHIKA